MKVDVSTSSPILRIEVDTDLFGEMFAGMSSDEQLAVLRSMVNHMRPHSAQWDYISIELCQPENKQFRDELNYVFKQIMEDET